MTISIDQNSHVLWDTVPKLQALKSAGLPCTHYIEDIDVAFTMLGAKPDQTELKISLEKFYPTGGCDWGASLFYSDFLGRLPVEPRTWEPMLGCKLSTYAKKAGITLEELYDQHATGDNWMLIGSSFIADRNHHRLLGDLTVKEVHAYIKKFFELAKNDCLRVFKGSGVKERVEKWFAAEWQNVLIHLNKNQGLSLDDFYDSWMNDYFGASDNYINIAKSSKLFALNKNSNGVKLLELFLQDYPRLSALYNQAVRDANLGLHELDTKNGELPFFVTLNHKGHKVRCEINLAGNSLDIAGREIALDSDRTLPLQKLKDMGVECLVGKAILLVIQVRMGKAGKPLVMPFHGSSYMPAAHNLAKLLIENKLIENDVSPILRVRFHLLDRLADADINIKLPTHLQSEFNAEEMPAKTFAKTYKNIADNAASVLDKLLNKSQSDNWKRIAFASEFDQIEKLNSEKMKLVRENPKQPAVREIGQQATAIKRNIDKGFIEKISSLYQTANIDFWDSRGAICPWCIAAGGEEFYQHVIANASVYEENHAKIEI